MAIREIVAIGGRVSVVSDIDDTINDYVKNGHEVPPEVLAAKEAGEETRSDQMNPEEALRRAAAIAEMPESDQDMINQLVKVANEAHKQLTDEDYTEDQITTIVKSGGLQTFLK